MEKYSVVTLTLNPAVDKSGEVERLVPAQKLRCDGERHEPGGGGINIARVLQRLGLESLAVFPSGGTMGQCFSGLVRKEGLSHLAIRIAGETRENVMIRDRVSGNQYRFLFAGPNISPQELDTCCETALSRLTSTSWLIASGSLPRGAPVDTYALLARRAAAIGARFVLDSSGPALQSAMTGRFALLKASEQELAQASGRTVTDRVSCIAAARVLIACGPETIAVTRGERGALYISNDFVWAANAPTINPASTVGAGDSFLAALIWKLAQSTPVAEALRYAVAAGSAALLLPGTALCHPFDMERLLPSVHVEQLPEVPRY